MKLAYGEQGQGKPASGGWGGLTWLPECWHQDFTLTRLVDTLLEEMNPQTGQTYIWMSSVSPLTAFQWNCHLKALWASLWQVNGESRCKHLRKAANWWDVKQERKKIIHKKKFVETDLKIPNCASLIIDFLSIFLWLKTFLKFFGIQLKIHGIFVLLNSIGVNLFLLKQFDFLSLLRCFGCPDSKVSLPGFLCLNRSPQAGAGYSWGGRPEIA